MSSIDQLVSADSAQESEPTDIVNPVVTTTSFIHEEIDGLTFEPGISGCPSS
jgi:hypothetical protein